MKRLAFVFTQPPHTTSSGREGLDALLAASAFSEDIQVFFVGDGVFQLLPDQKPAEILCRDYVATFGVMSLYDIEVCWGLRAGLLTFRCELRHKLDKILNNAMLC